MRILWAMWLAVMLMGLPLTRETARGADRPNVIFAFADDWGRYASVYAEVDSDPLSALVQTPHFDRVAEGGVLFTHAFVNAPSCTPCRSSLLSGQHFWRTGRGAILQGAVWDSSIPAWPLLLQESGYHIGHTYKVWSPGTPANAPYGAKATQYTKSGGRFNGYSQFVSRAPEPEAAHQRLADEVRGNFRSFLTDRGADQPFCYWWGPTNCHRKWVQGSGKELWEIDPDSLQGKMPSFLPDVPEIREDFADYLGEVRAFDAGLGVLLSELERIGELDNTIVIVSGDHGAPGFPRGKCNLYDFGTRVPLAICWPAKVRAGRVIRDVVSLPDLGPTLLTAAGVSIPEVMTGRDLTDVLESEAEGITDPDGFVLMGRERHVADVRPGSLPYPQRAIRTQRYLYIRNFEPSRWPMGDGPGFGRDDEMPPRERLRENTFAAFGDLDASPTKAWMLTEGLASGRWEREIQLAVGRRPEEELYDVSADPDQVNNLADVAELAPVLMQLREQLLGELRRTGDPRVTQETPVFEQPPFTDRFRR